MAVIKSQQPKVGNYVLGGLQADTYRVGFSDEAEVFAYEFFDDAPDINNATNIVVTAGGSAPGINAQLALGGHISGTVRDDAGNPLPGISVSVFRWNGTLWRWAGGLNTDASGNYDRGDLNTGTHRILFSDNSGTHVSQYVNNIAVTAGSTASAIDARLAPAGHITGTLTDAAGNPLYGWSKAYRRIGTRWAAFGASESNSSGYYDIGGLMAGTYRVEFGDASGTFAGEYFDDVANVTSARDIAVAAGATTSGIDAQALCLQAIRPLGQPPKVPLWPTRAGRLPVPLREWRTGS